ncbi:hypothetical protein ALC56_09395 [Trachymyrmex septentrionalis]|uniref:Uncharacterized protein n=1 Tax=Trachymyrmex septentrionalis TaxID=34720 RepID=A0A195F755_9HYME|nr:hypothetical protein ALC56_09395 [Trachymyrmex septentrionalis]
MCGIFLDPPYTHDAYRPLLFYLSNIVYFTHAVYTRSNDIGHSRSRFLARENSGLTSFSRRKSKFHRSRATIVTRRITSPPYARRAWKQTELHFGHIGENPFDNGSWGKEHFQPSTVPWQLNPRSHGRPSVSVFILSFTSSNLSPTTRQQHRFQTIFLYIKQ